MDDHHSSVGMIRKGYRDQLIYYCTIGLGAISEIAGVTVTNTLISTLKKRYKQLGGGLPITDRQVAAWFRERRKTWNGKLKFDISKI